MDSAMETCVLIPQELSLVLMDNEKSADKTMDQQSIGVYTNVRIPQGVRIFPFQGTIRIDKLKVFDYLEAHDIRHRFGLYDEITQGTAGRKVRHCNWVRFIRVAPTFSPDVNVLGTKYRGEPVYEVIKPIPADSEISVYYLPERPEDLLVPALHYFRTSLYRRTMGSILEESPLDLSTGLLSSKRGVNDEIKRDPTPPPSRAIHSPGRSMMGSTGAGSDADDRKSVSSECGSSSGVSPGGPPSSSSSTVGDGDLSPTPPTLPRPEDFLLLAASANSTTMDHFRATAAAAAAAAAAVAASTATATLPRKPRERTMLPCEVCGKAFDRPSLLKRHMRTHTGEKPHVCDVCGKGFSTSSSLNTHRRIHSGEKPHQCQVCGKRFTASSNLYYHRMTHIKEKPHKCTLCSKSFPTPGDLKSHMYVHNGSWPFKCHICNRGFSKHTNLKNHLFLHTGDKPHVCELCNKKFALACNLRAHMKTHEGEQEEECLKCGRTFTTAASANESPAGFCPTCRHGRIPDFAGESSTDGKDDDEVSGDTMRLLFRPHLNGEKQRHLRQFQSEEEEEEIDDIGEEFGG